MNGHSRAYKSDRPPRPDLPDIVRALRRAGQLQARLEGRKTGSEREPGLLDDWDLTWAQLDTMLAIRHLQSPDPEEALGVRGATEEIGEGAYQRLDALIDKGYAQKRPHPTHGRKKQVSLTEDGETALSQALLKLEKIGLTLDPKSFTEQVEDTANGTPT